MIVSKENINLKVLITGIFLYSMSTPFPKSIGLIEIIIGFCLLIGLLKGIFNLITFKKMLFTAIFYILLIYPLVKGVFNENYVTDIVRDIIPFIYLMIVMFVLSSNIKNNFSQKICKYMVFVGIIFSIRELLYWKSSGGLGVGVIMSTEEYIIQSPIVLFAGVYLFCMGFYYLNKYKLIRSFLSFALGGLPLLGFYYSVLRAPLILMILIPYIYALIISRDHILKIVFLTFMPIFILSFANINLQYYLSMFVEKQRVYGDNNKLAEINQIWIETVNADFLSLVFGKGWGGTWFSPAVGIEVSYAHSLIAYSLLKGGILGLTFFMIFLIVLLKYCYTHLIWVKNDSYKLALYLALLPPIFVNIFLESGYKTLGFGLIIAMFFCLQESFKKNRQNI